MNPSTANALFSSTDGSDPLFAPVDGADCPDRGAAAQTLDQKRAASSQLLTKGNIRIFLPVPAGAEYQIRIVSDPYGCETSSLYGLPAGVVSMYRRVLAATNLTMNAQFTPDFSGVPPQGAIMWDAREPTLQSQFIDATLGHAQASSTPADDQVTQGVNFELGLFTAQKTGQGVGAFDENGATAGPVSLPSVGTPFTPNFGVPNAFNTFDGWAASTNEAQASVNRGQTIFDTRQFSIVGVAGFNDVLGGGPVTGTCATCHNNLDMGSDVIPGGRHLGIGDNSRVDQSGNQTTATVLPPTSDQPLFSFLCPVGSIHFFSNPVVVDGTTYDELQTTDPGMALISGKCNDLGQFKVPRLRGLVARAPFFHGGNAAGLADVVEFYNVRFNIGLIAQ
ncbi:MAG: hypothetical protein FWD17_17565, partial [Polyangiaceae bacterium]|nr:hypothetical protein [Polyangiaceae bacterium]